MLCIGWGGWDFGRIWRGWVQMLRGIRFPADETVVEVNCSCIVVAGRLGEGADWDNIGELVSESITFCTLNTIKCSVIMFIKAKIIYFGYIYSFQNRHK